MSEAFDPYYSWLGIPPEDQPADHYQLLGIKRFEDNSSVVSNAADRQMRHVRAFQLGEHSDHSQTLLNELATARACLLNAASKAIYDQNLHAQIAEQTPPPVALPLRTANSPARRSGRSGRSLARSPHIQVVWILMGGIAGLSIGVLLLWYGFGMDVLGVMDSRDERLTKVVPHDDTNMRRALIADTNKARVIEANAEDPDVAPAVKRSIAVPNASPSEIRSRLIGTSWLHDTEHHEGTWFRFNADGTITASWHQLPSMWSVLPDGDVQMMFTKKRTIKTMRVDETLSSAHGVAGNDWQYRRIVADAETTQGVDAESESLEARNAASESISGPKAPPHGPLTAAQIRARLVGTYWLHDAGHNKETWFRFNADGTITASWHELPNVWAVLPDGTVQMIFTQIRTVNRMQVDATFKSATGIGRNDWLYRRVQE